MVLKFSRLCQQVSRQEPSIETDKRRATAASVHPFGQADILAHRAFRVHSILGHLIGAAARVSLDDDTHGQDCNHWSAKSVDDSSAEVRVPCRLIAEKTARIAATSSEQRPEFIEHVASKRTRYPDTVCRAATAIRWSAFRRLYSTRLFE